MRDNIPGCWLPLIPARFMRGVGKVVPGGITMYPPVEGLGIILPIAAAVFTKFAFVPIKLGAEDTPERSLGLTRKYDCVCMSGTLPPDGSRMMGLLPAMPAIPATS